MRLNNPSTEYEVRALSSVWTECLASDQVVAGSNPAAPIRFPNDANPTDSGQLLIKPLWLPNLISFDRRTIPDEGGSLWDSRASEHGCKGHNHRGGWM